MLVIVLSSRSKESIVPSTNENDISMEQISDDHELLGINTNYLILTMKTFCLPFITR